MSYPTSFTMDAMAEPGTPVTVHKEIKSQATLLGSPTWGFDGAFSDGQASASSPKHASTGADDGTAAKIAQADKDLVTNVENAMKSPTQPLPANLCLPASMPVGPYLLSAFQNHVSNRNTSKVVEKGSATTDKNGPAETHTCVPTEGEHVFVGVRTGANAHNTYAPDDTKGHEHTAIKGNDEIESGKTYDEVEASEQCIESLQADDVLVTHQLDANNVDGGVDEGTDGLKATQNENGDNYMTMDVGMGSSRQDAGNNGVPDEGKSPKNSSHDTTSKDTGLKDNTSTGTTLKKTTINAAAIEDAKTLDDKGTGHGETSIGCTGIVSSNKEPANSIKVQSSNPKHDCQETLPNAIGHAVSGGYPINMETVTTKLSDVRVSSDGAENDPASAKKSGKTGDIDGISNKRKSQRSDLSPGGQPARKKRKSNANALLLAEARFFTTGVWEDPGHQSHQRLRSHEIVALPQRARTPLTRHDATTQALRIPVRQRGIIGRGRGSARGRGNKN
ncbi:hypothetical protein K470DRAFT_263989 [Piedraia hortae CBS 480.64]|uniref:Uncharacterized protein n=1 Tax=Piedraia hortae CBS 480.64 TaxID=1314780 RepID=A0A6A7C216_9PEZI|nr:hypothetical protein K470DRAFT_263989 [Piedraia hortae CBS 480.64]